MNEPKYEHFETRAISSWQITNPEESTEWLNLSDNLRNLIDRSSFSVLSANSWKTLEGWRIPIRKRSYSYLWVIESGQVAFSLGQEGKSVILKRNDYLIIPNNIAHNVSPVGNSDMVCKVFHFEYKYLNELDLFTISGIQLIHGKLTDYQISLVREYCIVIHNDLTDWRFWAVSSLFNMFYPRIINELISTTKKSDLPSPKGTLRYIVPVLEYINENINRKEMRLFELAELSNLSEAYLRRLFHEYTGKSPVKYILERKLERARQMLVNSNLTVSSVAESCGFENATYFYKTFKKRFGLSPSLYRRKPDI